MNSSAIPLDMHTTLAAHAPLTERMNFIRKTYLLFLAGVVNAVLAGAISITTPIGLFILQLSPWSFLGLLAVCWVAQTVADEPRYGYPALFGFTFLLGLFMGPAVAMVSVSVLVPAAVLSVIIFGTLTAYVFVTRQDFNFMGGFLCVALVSLVLGAVLNSLFFQISGLHYWISWGVLLLSSGWVLYDTSNIIHRYPLSGYCGAALGLFISFWNIFISLVSILQGRDD